jgi:hypothetical protein
VPSFSTWRINSGGPAYTDTAGHAWSADTAFVGGNSNGNGNSVANTGDPALYQTERWGNPGFSYRLAVPAGSYQVTLKFAEIFDNGAGQRIMNLSLNGTQVLANLDVFSDAGGFNRADDKVFNNVAPAADGFITVLLQTTAASPDKNAALKALQVIPQPPVPTSTRTPTPPPASACSGVPAWAANVAYAVGQQVSYGNRLYRCLQAHTSLTGWEPPNVPALWTDLGSCGGPSQLSSARLDDKQTPSAVPTPGPSLLAGPNPAKDWVRVFYTLDQPGQARLRLSSLEGAGLQVIDLGSQAAGRGEWTLRLDGVASGIYLVDLEVNAGEGWVKKGTFKVAVRK